VNLETRMSEDGKISGASHEGEGRSERADSLELTFGDFQTILHRMYGEKDARRGVEGTFMWLMEEVGELSTALREGNQAELAGEFADVIAWVTTLANLRGINLTEALANKYGGGCPGCRHFVCRCPQEEKP
jgi:NTP pyrophosphatase (non-canonical NTP hydrolase)